jgi:hypothetical protein
MSLFLDALYEVRIADKRMAVMHRHGYDDRKIWFTALLLLILPIFGVGCADLDNPGQNPDVTPPTVTSAAPAAAANGACSNTTVTATFSKSMNASSFRSACAWD